MSENTSKSEILDLAIEEYLTGLRLGSVMHSEISDYDEEDWENEKNKAREQLEREIKLSGTNKAKASEVRVDALVSTTGENIYEIDEFDDQLFEEIEAKVNPPAKVTFIKKGKDKYGTIYEIYYWYLGYKSNPRYQGDDGLDLFCKCRTIDIAREIVKGQMALAKLQQRACGC
jgi:hypothetical protein